MKSKKSRFDRADLVTLLGVIVLSVGLWLIWPPLALTMLGAILIFTGLVMAGKLN